MDDLEITKLCAEAMGFEYHSAISEHASHLLLRATNGSYGKKYDPLHDDAQAMALVKKFGLQIRLTNQSWHVWDADDSGCVLCKDLNRAICECVAKMQQAKKG